MLSRFSGILVVATLAWCPSALAQVYNAPKMVTQWLNLTISQQACLERGKAVMVDEGFTHDLQSVGESVYGALQGHTAAIKCVATKSIVVFVVAGPDFDRVMATARSLSSRFNR